MSFRKRNTVISSPIPKTRAASIPYLALPPSSSSAQNNSLPPGLRPSPLDGRLTTSTGTSSLDHLLAGHVGLPSGTSLLAEEQGTTDFSGTLLKYYAAQGLVHGHHVHVLGFPHMWNYELPGLVVDGGKAASSQTVPPPPEDRMKIAWRYAALGNMASPQQSSLNSAAPFCHSFDLTKRLSQSDIKGELHATPCPKPFHATTRPVHMTADESSTILQHFLDTIYESLESSSPSEIHRIAIPSLLSPTLYPPSASHPHEVLQFLHGLRALLREYPTRLTAIISLPLFLFPRTTGLTRWMELLSDGVIELIPLPADPAADPADKSSKNQGQGILKVHSLPIYHEKGGGGTGGHHFREDLTFSLSASKGLVIKPYSLPPLGEEGKEKSPASTVKDGMDF